MKPHEPTIRAFEDGDLAGLEQVIHGALAEGDLPGWTRYELDYLIERMPLDREATLVADLAGRPVGTLSMRNNLLVVDASHRRQGIGSQLLRTGEALGPGLDVVPLLLEKPDGLAPAAAFLDHNDYVYHSTLWRMEFRGDPPRAGALPAGISSRRYEVDDLVPYVALMNDSFADDEDPTGRVSVDYVAFSHGKPEFDPEDIRILVDDASGAMAGFVRTAVEKGDDGERYGHVRVLGLPPEWRGRGMGRWLLDWGVGHLLGKGVERVTLEVLGQNDRALQLYRSTGFTEIRSWPRWTRRAAITS